MNAERLLQHFDRISEAPDAIPRLRRFILDLAVRGKLIEQDPNDEPAEELLQLVKNGAATHTDPTGWIFGAFGSLLELQYGKGLPAKDRREYGAIPVFGSNGIVGYTDAALTDKPAIIVGRKGSAGALNLSDGPSWTTDVAYFIVPPAYFDVRFLIFTLETLDLGALGKGVKPGLSRSDAYQLPLTVPPLTEQHRIVAKVDELMALCDQFEAAKSEREQSRDRLVAASLHHLSSPADTLDADAPDTFRDHVRFIFYHLPRLITRPAHIKQLRQTILNLAVVGQLVPQNPNDEPAADLLERIQTEKTQLVKEGIIPRQKVASSDLNRFAFEYPVKWEAVNFGDVCNLVTSGSRGWAEFYSDAGAKFIRAQNIRFGRLRLDDLACVNPPKKTEGTRTQVSTGDLLIVITGAGVTNPALLDHELGEAYVSQHVALIKPTATSLSRWLLLCLMAPAGGRAELIERAYGAGKPGLNLDNIRSLKIPLPPLAEQHRIVAKVDQLMVLCDQLEAELITTEADRSRLLEAVLYEALAPDLEEAS